MWEIDEGCEGKQNTLPVSLGQWAWDREIKSELGSVSMRRDGGILIGWVVG